MAKPKNKKKKPPAPKRPASKPAPKETTDEKILAAVRAGLKECIDDEETERSKMRDDLRFCTLDQWPDDIRKERENDVENGPRPCLTIDKINQYIVQVVNDMRQGKPGINVRPQDDDSDVETAKILKGLVRNIEDQSNADIAYAMAGESAAKIGLGFFRVTTEWASEDSHDQEIFIRPIPNTFSTYLSRHIMPDGSDATRGYIVEAMPKDKFKTEFPKAKFSARDFEGLDADIAGYWKTEETITVVEEYVIESVAQELHFLSDGTTITQPDYDAWPEEAGAKPSIQKTRTTLKKQLKWRKVTGVEVLDKRDLPGKYVPIVEVIGREAHVEGRRILWGLVRPAKDSLRMYNYWASTITEKMALAPKTPYVGAKGQFAGVEERWKSANRVNRSYLEYEPIDVNGNALPAPRRQESTPIEAALLNQMKVIEHDVQTSLGMFKAATGESESQQSGRAILALQRESDTGTYHFGANQGISIRHAGRIIVDLIPHYYDTKRIVRIIGEDGEVHTAQLDPDQDEAHRQIQGADGAIKNIYNPGVGKYDISITVGPNYNTKRMEAAATFVEMAKGATDPGSAAVMRYLTVKNSDFTHSDEAAKMLKALLPPQVLQSMEGDGQAAIPPQVLAKMQQMGQQMQGMQEAGQKLQQENAQLKSGAAAAQAKIKAEHDARMMELQYERECEQEKAQLAREKATAEVVERRRAAMEAAELEKWEAGLKARTEIEVAEIRAGATVQASQIAAAAAATRPAAGAS